MARQHKYPPPVPLCLSWEEAHEYAWQIVMEHEPLLIARTAAVWGGRKDFQRIRDDLLDAGRDAMFSAAWRFDPTKGQWSTYATRAIWSRQYHAVRTGAMIRVPVRHAEPQIIPLNEEIDQAYEPDLIERVHHDDRVTQVLRKVETLPYRQQVVVLGRYFHGVPILYRTLGAKLGMSKQRVHQIELEAIQQLRTLLT